MAQLRTATRDVTRRALAEERLAEEQQSALAIQRTFRDYATRKECRVNTRTLVEQQGMATTFLQGVCRAYVLRRNILGPLWERWVQSRYRPLLTVQRVGKGFLIRRRTLLLARKKQLPQYVTRHHANAAVIIQKNYRGFTSRRIQSENKQMIDAAASSIQRAYRRSQYREKSKKKYLHQSAATAIQRVFRGHSTRNQVQKGAVATSRYVQALRCTVAQGEQCGNDLHEEGSLALECKADGSDYIDLNAYQNFEDEEVDSRQYIILEECDAWISRLDTRWSWMQSIAVEFTIERRRLISFEFHARQIERAEEATARREMYDAIRTLTYGAEHAILWSDRTSSLLRHEESERSELLDHCDLDTRDLFEHIRHERRRVDRMWDKKCKHKLWMRQVDRTRGHEASVSLRNVLQQEKERRALNAPRDPWFVTTDSSGSTFHRRQIPIPVDRKKCLRAQQIRDERHALSCLPKLSSTSNIESRLNTTMTLESKEEACLRRQRQRDEQNLTQCTRAQTIRSRSVEMQRLLDERRSKSIATKREAVRAKRLQTPLALQIFCRAHSEADDKVRLNSSFATELTANPTSPNQEILRRLPPSLSLSERHTIREGNRNYLAQLRQQRRMETESTDPVYTSPSPKSSTSSWSHSPANNTMRSSGEARTTTMKRTLMDSHIVRGLNACDDSTVREFYQHHIEYPHAPKLHPQRQFEDTRKSQLAGTSSEDVVVGWLLRSAEVMRSVESGTCDVDDALGYLKDIFNDMQSTVDAPAGDTESSDQRRECVSIVLNNIAIVCHRRKDAASGLHYLSTALSVEETMTAGLQFPGTLLNACVLLTSLGDGSTACAYARRALEQLSATARTNLYGEKSKSLMVQAVFNLSMAQFITPSERRHAPATLENAARMANVFLGQHSGVTRQVEETWSQFASTQLTVTKSEH